MLIFTLKILLAHIVGDFVLQPDSWVEKRETGRYKSKYLYFHALVHLTLLLLLFFNEIPRYYLGFLAIAAFHLLIDLGKIYAKKKIQNAATLFIIDQFLHLTVIGGVVCAYFFRSIDWCFEPITFSKLLLIVIAILLCTVVGAVFIKLFFQKWGNNFNWMNGKETLPDAGKYIGILERLMILLFICTDLFSGVGFLLAAKSIFRFGDLTRSKEKQQTEYVLLGTFLSFTIGIIFGFALKYLLEIV